MNLGKECFSSKLDLNGFLGKIKIPVKKAKKNQDIKIPQGMESASKNAQALASSSGLAANPENVAKRTDGSCRGPARLQGAFVKCTKGCS